MTLPCDLRCVAYWARSRANNEQLAETFAAPDRVERLKQIILRRAETPYSDAALRAAIQGRAISAR